MKLMAPGAKLAWNSWTQMMERCYNPEHINAKHYSEKGISVCERWHSFENFLEDMGERPSKEYSLDRINGDLGYSPGNCRWATKTEQQNNLSSNRWLTYQGKTQTVSQWSRDLGLTSPSLHQRIRQGGPIEDILGPRRNERHQETRELTFNGKTQSLGDWADELGIPRERLWNRIFTKNMPLEQALQSGVLDGSKIVTYQGKTQTVLEWSKELGIDWLTLHRRLRRMPLERAMEARKLNRWDGLRDDNRVIEFNGVSDSLSGWAKRIGVSPSAMLKRLDKWPLERALTEIPKGNTILEYKGDQYTLSEASRKFGISKNTLTKRLGNGWSVEAALEVKPDQKFNTEARKRRND